MGFGLKDEAAIGTGQHKIYAWAGGVSTTSLWEHAEVVMRLVRIRGKIDGRLVKHVRATIAAYKAILGLLKAGILAALGFYHSKIPLWQLQMTLKVLYQHHE